MTEEKDLELTSFDEHTKIIKIKQTLIKRLEDILHPKTKEKLQDGRRGTQAMYSNPIPYEWMTHKLGE